ncbi:helix-turn-helix domain-containing protein [Acidovorax sp. 22279]|uniref:helix-turn-helix domain-containing protein n=1 Tax=Acidovorax sp. 22279 TaxID=3453900 RepID=UPI003F864989
MISASVAFGPSPQSRRQVESVDALRRRWRVESGQADATLIERLRSLLLQRADNPPSLAEVADALLLSPRTLRRRLHALDTRFSDVMAEVRCEMARRYLIDTSWSVERIAEEVGYSDAANFRQALKRWTGQSPRRYRASVR